MELLQYGTFPEVFMLYKNKLILKTQTLKQQKGMDSPSRHPHISHVII